MTDTQRPERVLTADRRNVIVSVPLFDQMEAEIASLTTRLEQAEGALREAHQGIAFIIAAAGGEVRVPKSVMLHDYTVTRVDSPVDDDVRFTAALSPTGEPKEADRDSIP